MPAESKTRSRIRRALAGPNVWPCLWLTALAFSVACGALQPGTPLTNLGWQNWTIENGLPQNTITDLYQSPEGYLWAGTELGLARFDGNSFFLLNHATTAQFPDAEIHALLALPPSEGNSDKRGLLSGLWIGTSDGVVLWRDGRARRFSTPQGLPSAQIRGLAATADGTLWVWTDGGLASTRDGESFQRASPPGAEESITSMLAQTTGDALWVATTRALWRWQSGAGQSGAGQSGVWQRVLTSATPPVLAGADNADNANDAVLVGTGHDLLRMAQNRVSTVAAGAALPHDGVQRMALLADGTVAVADSDELVLLSGSAHVLARYRCGTDLPGTRIATLFADRSGALWIGTNHGLARWFRGNLDRMPASNLIASEAIRSILEDREGSLWLGTETGGLYILRDARFHFLDESNGLSAADTTAIVEAADHSLWVGTRESGLNHIPALMPKLQPGAQLEHSLDYSLDHSHALTTANGLPSNVILALASARDGSVWVGTPDGLSHLRGHTLTTITAADNLPDDFIRSLYVSHSQMLWIGTRHGLSCLDPSEANDPIQTWITVNGLGSDLIGAMTETTNGTLWVATLHGLARLRTAPGGCKVEGAIHNYTTADGLSGDVITALVGNREWLWIGTQDHGLSLWNGSRFLTVPVDIARQLPATIHGLTVDETGALWMTAEDGIYRLSAAALAARMTNSAAGDAPLAIDHFTPSDGLRSRQTSSDSHPTILRSHDGRLWFTTPRGVVYLDPNHFGPLPPPPPVVIERFTVDDRPQPIRAGRPDVIPAGHLRFEFDYAGLSFAMPQRVQYEYRLEGFDRGWTVAGTRRTAYYTNIPQGRYRFQVRAYLGEPGNGHPWTETEIAFVLRPHFYQTIWFYLLLAALVGALVLVVVRWRLYLARRRFDAVMAERNRIAREIHDTLAQGYVGVSVQLEVLGELLRRERLEAVGSQLQRLQQLVRDGLDDARRSIWALRSHDASEQTLPVRLRRLVETTAAAELNVTVDIHGATRQLEPETEEELLRVAQEAIQNVRKHAHATRLALRLEYDDRTVVLTVTDNGVGFPAMLQSSAPESPAGHFGLTGMRERAELVGAILEITSQPGAGTTVRMIVPEGDDQREKES